MRLLMEDKDDAKDAKDVTTIDTTREDYRMVWSTRVKFLTILPSKETIATRYESKNVVVLFPVDTKCL